MQGLDYWFAQITGLIMRTQLTKGITMQNFTEENMTSSAVLDSSTPQKLTLKTVLVSVGIALVGLVSSPLASHLAEL